MNQWFSRTCHFIEQLLHASEVSRFGSQSLLGDMSNRHILISTDVMSHDTPVCIDGEQSRKKEKRRRGSGREGIRNKRRRVGSVLRKKERGAMA
ncbi:hypothetical protein MUK42_16344 [Musa troglodytarum]|uniref:Uncharacterized protein n=1 Tax=Musa troglodytarum TaxID=320322 RepID=A0A9E7KW39_9LILI|nr:hypothetical protein MUK42_16344 [Musa troglodytarum]